MSSGTMGGLLLPWGLLFITYAPIGASAVDRATSSAGRSHTTGTDESVDNQQSAPVAAYLFGVSLVLFFFITLWRCLSLVQTPAARGVLSRSMRGSRGVTQKTRMTFKYYSVEQPLAQAMPAPIHGEGQATPPGTCSICLGAFMSGETICLVTCGHSFHNSCCSIWLEGHSTCPMCRADLNELAGQKFSSFDDALSNSERGEGVSISEQTSDIQEGPQLYVGSSSLRLVELVR